jgi:DNA-binding response OmpR family regulator
VPGRRILVAGISTDVVLARFGKALSLRDWDVVESESSGEIDYVLGAERSTACVFDAARYESLFLRRLRRRHPGTVMVAWTPGYSSARSTELLEAGAAEVLNGAMAEPELIARIERAVQPRRPAGDIVVGPLRIDAETGVASWANEEIVLTRRERELLETLARASGKTVRRESVYRDVWGFVMARGDRTVDVNVKRLRAKLAKTATGLRIQTHPGVGYRLEVDDAVPADPPVVTQL